MADALTLDDLVDVAVEHILATPGTKLSETALRRPGSDADLLLGGCAAMGEEVAGQVVDAAAGLLLDTAEDERLDRLVFDLPFQVERMPAAPALVPLRFARASAAAGAGTITAGTRVTLDGVTFRTVLDAPLSAVALSVDVDAQAEVTGPAGNIASGVTGAIVGTVFDTLLTVTNTAVGAGGRNRESNASLRARARAAQETARRGTLPAIENGALTVPQVAYASAFEQLDADGVQTGWISLIVSDEDGNSNAAITAQVALVLREFRGAGIPVAVSAGVVRLEDIVIAATYVPGFDTNEQFDLGAARVMAYVNALAPGETLDPGRIGSAFLGESPAVTGIKGAKVIEPSGPVQPASDEVIRTSRPLISQGSY